MAAVLLDDEVLQAIFAHADQGYPEEVCGLVFAERAEHGYPNAEALRCENQRRSGFAYAFGDKALLALAESLDTDRPARIVYHSHVDAVPTMSAADVAAAAPGGVLLYPVDHLVIEASARGARGARLYRFVEGAFVQIAAFGAR